MKILLFGGSGFLSGKIVEQAIKKDHSVITITRGEREVKELENVTNIYIDRDKVDTKEIANILKGNEWDVVIDSICRNRDHAKQSILLSKECRRLIMISTDYVYDPEHRKLMQNEDEAVFSKGETYGANKRKAEIEIIEAINDNLIDGTILRPPHIYGPGSNLGTIPNHGRKPELLNYINKGNVLQLVQGGLGLIQPISVYDLSRIIIEILSLKISFGKIFNSPGNELITHKQYYMEIARCLNKDIQIEPLDFESEKKINLFPCGHRYYDNTKIINLLPSFNYTLFSNGMKSWIQYLIKNQENNKI